MSSIVAFCVKHILFVLDSLWSLRYHKVLCCFTDALAQNQIRAWLAPSQPPACKNRRY